MKVSPTFGLLPVCLLLTATLSAQQKAVTGKVTNEADGKPLPVCSVIIKGTTTGTSTGNNGAYNIMADPAKDSLVFTFIGYETKTVAIKGKTILNVGLTSNKINMDDVIVVGYGTKKKIEVLGATATVTGQEIQDIPAPNIAAALRNRIPGVSVDAVSGRPGAGITLNVRSATVTALAGTYGITDEPLYVIDNVTVPKSTFDNLDPALIENLTVLKDATAAIYGAAGAKGVILVTTKKGKAGKITATYNGYVGVTDATVTPKMLSAYDQAVVLNDGFRASKAAMNKFFSDDDLEYLKNSNIKGWYDELWQSSVAQRHNLSFSGGTDKLTFFAGGSYSRENANYAGMHVEKYTFRSGMTGVLTNGLKTEINFNVDGNKKVSDNGLSENDQTFYQQLITTPQWVPMLIDGKPVNYSNISANNNTNPYAAIHSGNNVFNQGNGYRINVNLTYTPAWLQGFTARLQVSQAGGNTNGTTYRPPYTIYNFIRRGNNQLLFSDTLQPTKDSTTLAIGQSNTRYEPNLDKSSSYQGFLTLQYRKQLAKHTFDLMVGGEQSVSKGEGLDVYWINQILSGADYYWAFDLNSLVLKSRSISETHKRSFFGRFNYNFANKYFLEGIGRLDASSNFAANHLWGLFPTVGVGWVVSNEPFFMNNVHFINYLKLRVNYGEVGDDRVTSRLWQDRYTIDPANSGYVYNETNVASLNPSIKANPDISWEKARTVNAGAELSLLNNKLNLNVEVFYKHAYDMFDKGLDASFPMYAGFKSPVVNNMSTITTGSEFSIGYRARLAKDLNFNVSVNFGFSRVIIEKMFINNNLLWENSLPNWQISVGSDPVKYSGDNIGLITKGMLRSQQEVDALLAKYPNYTINGKQPQPGWLYFEDANGDGKITDQDMRPMFRRTIPVVSTGITLGFTYRSLTLSTNIAANIGGKAFYDGTAIKPPTDKINAPDIWRDHWSLDNPNGKMPRFDDESIARGWNTTFWARNGTMIRINNMTLAYRLPRKLLDKAGIQGCSIMLTGNNLWTIVNPLPYKDPYSSYIYDYPMLRVISGGFNFSF